MSRRVVEITDPELVRRYFEADPEVHLYGLADLDEPIWSTSRWWGLETDNELLAVVADIRLEGISTPIFYAQGRADDVDLVTLAGLVSDEIPDSCMAVLALGVVESLDHFRVEPEGVFQRMVLRDHHACEAQAQAKRAGVGDLERLWNLIVREKSEITFLSPTMLEEVDYRVATFEGEVVAMAGVHIYSERASVAAIGNVLTAADHRREGLASKLISDLCAELIRSVGLIGLNHRVGNMAAERCYEKLGFAAVHTYWEGSLYREA